MLCVFVVTAARLAQGESPTRIVVVSSPSTEPTMLRRLRAELAGLGFLVVDVESMTDATPESLADTAREQHAFAAIRVVSARGGVTVWIADLVTGKTVLRTLAGSESDVSGEVVALRAVELLRASLMELTLWRGPNGEAPPELRAIIPESATAAAPTEPDRVLLQIAPGALLDGGTGWTGQIDVGARFRALESFGIRAFAFFPVFSESLRKEEGEANVSAALAGLGLDVDLTRATSDWKVRLGVSAALSYLRVEAIANTAYVARTETFYTGAPLLQSSVTYRLTPKLGLALGLYAGVSVPRPVIYFADRRVAAWGRPLMGGSLGIEYGAL